jgi:hypothetical protein
MDELLKVGWARSSERFPDKRIRPCASLFGYGWRCTFLVDNEIVVAEGECINECVDNLLESIDSIVNRKEQPVMHVLS